MQCNSSWSISAPPGMNLFLPTLMFEPGIQTSKGRQGLSARLASNTTTTFNALLAQSFLHRGLLLHFPLLLYLGDVGELWLAGSALTKPLKLKRLRLAHVLQNTTFFFFSLEHCSFALAGKAGQDRDSGKRVVPVVLCAAICKLWAELHCAGIDLHLPRIITP